MPGWSRHRRKSPAWRVHYQADGSDEHVSPPLSEDEARDQLADLRAFNMVYPPTRREFLTEHGPVSITSFASCRAWIDTSK